MRKTSSLMFFCTTLESLLGHSPVEAAPMVYQGPWSTTKITPSEWRKPLIAKARAFRPAIPGRIPTAGKLLSHSLHKSRCLSMGEYPHSMGIFPHCEPGILVVALHCGWRDHPHIRRKVGTRKQIRFLHSRYVEFVYNLRQV